MKKNLIYLLLLIMTFLDLITSLNERYSFFLISPNLLFKCLIISTIIFYILFITKNKYKKLSIIYLFFLTIFIITYFIIHLSSSNLLIEINNMFKFIYYPLLLIGLINLNQDKLIEFSKINKTLRIIFLIYLIMLFIPNLLSIGFNTYSLSYLKGQIGWFYAANEISAILIMLYPFIIYYLLKKKYLIYYVILFISVYSLNSIGTKTATIGLVLGTSLMLIYYLIKELKVNKKSLIHFVLTLTIVFVFSLNSYAISNHKQNIYYLEHPNLNVEVTTKEEENTYKINIDNPFIKALFSNRLKYFENTLNVYLEKPIIEKIVGIGFSNKLAKYIEMDIFDYFFHYGVIGFIMMFIPSIGIIIIYLKKKDYQIIKNMPSFISLSLGFLTSLIAGHIFNAPSVSTIYSILLITLIISKKEDNYYADILSHIYSDNSEKLYRLIHHNLKNNIKTFVITANAETLTLSKTNENINHMLNDPRNLIVPDGIALVKACNLYNLNIQERITGIDLVSYLLDILNKEHKTLYLFGSTKDNLNSLIKNINSKYPHIDIIGSKDGYIKDKDKVFDEISKLAPDVCLVALGIPLQEELISKHLNKFSKGIFIGVGGSFDVLSGNKKRAPKIFIKLNLEWLYRTLKEPKRLKRFIKYNINFIIDVFLSS